MKPAHEAVQYMADAINTRLDDNQRVLWLVSGGSAIKVAIDAFGLLHREQLGHLTFSLVDERYGDVGHHDSNWQQLLEAGLDLTGASSYPILEGKGMDETVEDFQRFLSKQLNEADFTIGLFGIGIDGHTAGILPGSPAAHATELATGYDGGGYQRITMTVPAVAQLDEAVAYAAGEAKWPILDKLQQDIPVSDQPAQALKQAGKFIVFTDHIEAS